MKLSIIDECREQCILQDSHITLGNLLRQCISLPSAEENVKLKTVVCGCILNLCCNNGTRIDTSYDVVHQLLYVP